MSPTNPLSFFSLPLSLIVCAFVIVSEQKPSAATDAEVAGGGSNLQRVVDVAEVKGLYSQTTSRSLSSSPGRLALRLCVLNV